LQAFLGFFGTGTEKGEVFELDSYGGLQIFHA
jgi:hypothetical protein